MWVWARYSGNFEMSICAYTSTGGEGNIQNTADLSEYIVLESFSNSLKLFPSNFLSKNWCVSSLWSKDKTFSNWL